MLGIHFRYLLMEIINLNFFSLIRVILKSNYLKLHDFLCKISDSMHGADLHFFDGNSFLLLRV